MIASHLIREKLPTPMGEVLPYVQMFRVLEEVFQNLDDKIHCSTCDEVFDLKNFLAFWQVRYRWFYTRVFPNKTQENGSNKVFSSTRNALSYLIIPIDLPVKQL